MNYINNFIIDNKIVEGQPYILMHEGKVLISDSGFPVQYVFRRDPADGDWHMFIFSGFTKYAKDRNSEASADGTFVDVLNGLYEVGTMQFVPAAASVSAEH